MLEFEVHWVFPVHWLGVMGLRAVQGQSSNIFFRRKYIPPLNLIYKNIFSIQHLVFLVLWVAHEYRSVQGADVYGFIYAEPERKEYIWIFKHICIFEYIQIYWSQIFGHCSYMRNTVSYAEPLLYKWKSFKVPDSTEETQKVVLRLID